MCKALAKWCDEYKDESGTGPTLRELTSSVEIHLVYKYLVTKSNIRKYTVGLLSARVGVKGAGSMGGVRRDRVVPMGGASSDVSKWGCWGPPGEDGQGAVRKCVTRAWKAVKARDTSGIWSCKTRFYCPKNLAGRKGKLTLRRGDSDIQDFLLRQHCSDWEVELVKSERWVKIFYLRI